MGGSNVSKGPVPPNVHTHTNVFRDRQNLSFSLVH